MTALRDEKFYTEAETRQKKIVELDKQIYGPDSSSTGLSWNKLGEIQTDLENFTEAESSLKEAVRIREKKEDFDTSVSRDNLARVYEALGRLEEAKEMRMRGRPKQNITCGNYSVS